MHNYFSCISFDFVPGKSAKYCDEYVCLSVCSRKLQSTKPIFTKFFYACCLWPQLNSPLTAL